MKLLQKIAAGTLALGLVGYASAATDIYVCGSTAFRSAVVNTEISLLGGAGVVATAEADTSAVTSASISAVSGSNGGNAIIFHNHWTGSVAGVVDISNSNPLTYIADASLGGAGTNTPSAALDSSTHVPLVAMSDNVAGDAQTVLANANAAGKTFGLGIGSAGPVDGGTGAGSNGGPVAVCTFEWVLGAISGGQPTPTNWAATGTGLTATGAMPYNITQDVASALLTNGNIPLSVVTGNAADGANFLLFVGRNEDSGSRVLYQGESWGAGSPASHPVSSATKQWMLEQSTTPGGTAIASGYPTSSSGAGYPSISTQGGITALKLWPAAWTLNTETSVTWSSPAHSGYNGGGDVAKILASPNPVTSLTFTSGGQPTGYVAGTSQLYFVTCIGTSDGPTTVGAGGVLLAYNGVPYSQANVENGQYACWNYEHLYYLPALAGVQKTGADALADAIYNSTSAQLGAAGLPIPSMVASRATGSGAQIK